MLLEYNKKSLSECNNIKQFECIDFMRAICAILVVAIHIPPFGEAESDILQLFNYIIKDYLARIAVPFYFMCTGFLVFRRMDIKSNSFNVATEYVKRTFRFYVLWTLLYSIFIIIELKKKGKGIVDGAVLFFRNFFLVGSYSHLWYLLAVVVAIGLILFLLSKRVDIKKILLMAFILYFMGLLPQTYFGLMKPLEDYPFIWNVLKFISKIIYTTRNGLFEGFLFVGLGMMLAYKPLRMSLRNAVIGFGVSMLMFGIEIIWLTKWQWIRVPDMFLGMIPVTFFLFYIVSHIHLKHPIDTYKLRLVSNLVYFIHVWIKNLLLKVMEYIGSDLVKTGLPFLITLGGSIIIAIAIIKLSQYPRFMFLKKLYL